MLGKAEPSKTIRLTFSLLTAKVLRILQIPILRLQIHFLDENFAFVYALFYSWLVRLSIPSIRAPLIPAATSPRLLSQCTDSSRRIVELVHVGFGWVLEEVVLSKQASLCLSSAKFNNDRV